MHCRLKSWVIELETAHVLITSKRIMVASPRTSPYVSSDRQSTDLLCVMNPGPAWVASDLRTPCGASALDLTFPRMPVDPRWRVSRPRVQPLRCSRSSMKKWLPAPVPRTTLIMNAIKVAHEALLPATVQAP